MFDWSPEYGVGHPDIDAEHRALFRLAQELHTAVTEGRAQDELGRLFASLVAYTRFHFAAEEKLMRDYRLPSTEEHVREHRKLTERVSELESDYLSGAAAEDLQTLRFLERWLHHHILGTDRGVAAKLLGPRPR